MTKLKMTVKVTESVRDMIQRLFLDYYQKEKVLKGLIEDHQYDDNPAEFLESEIFKAYENKTAKALLAYETASEEMKNTYIPEEFKNLDNFRWRLDYDSCNLTFTQA